MIHTNYTHSASAFLALLSDLPAIFAEIMWMVFADTHILHAMPALSGTPLMFLSQESSAINTCYLLQIECCMSSEVCRESDMNQVSMDSKLDSNTLTLPRVILIIYLLPTASL